MIPFGWHTPLLVDNTDTLYLGDQITGIDNRPTLTQTLATDSVGFLRFLFAFFFNCLSSGQSVFSSMCNLFLSFLRLDITIKYSLFICKL